jgi:hypothetical protein
LRSSTARKTKTNTNNPNQLPDCRRAAATATSNSWHPAKTQLAVILAAIRMSTFVHLDSQQAGMIDDGETPP